MGSSLRDRCGSAARALLLSGLLALTWLVWGAGTADAAPAGPSSGTVDQLRNGLPLHGPGLPLGAASAAATLVTHPLKIQEVPLPVAPPATVVAVVAGTADAVFNEAATAVVTVANGAAPVLGQAAPVLTEIADVTAPVAVAVPVPLAVPLAVPLPVSTVVPAPVRLPETSGNEARPAAAPVAALPQQVQAAGAQGIAGPGLATAQFPVYAVDVAGLPAVDEYLAPSPPPNAPLDTERLLWLASLQGHSGSASSGPGGSGTQPAGDAAGFWNHWDTFSSARTPDTAQRVAAGPSFDPGSSPD